MKKQSELDYSIVLYEYQRKRDTSISKAKQIRSNRFIFQKKDCSAQEEAVSKLKKDSKEDDLI